jgi:hypothetical protein
MHRLRRAYASGGRRTLPLIIHIAHTVFIMRVWTAAVGFSKVRNPSVGSFRKLGLIRVGVRSHGIFVCLNCSGEHRSLGVHIR